MPRSVAPAASIAALRTIAKQFHAIARDHPWLKQLILFGPVNADELPHVFARVEGMPSEAAFEHGLEVVESGTVALPIASWCIIPEETDRNSEAMGTRSGEFRHRMQVCHFGEAWGNGRVTVLRGLAEAALRCIPSADLDRWTRGLPFLLDPLSQWSLVLHRVAMSAECPAVITVPVTAPPGKSHIRFPVKGLQGHREDGPPVGDWARSIPDPPTYWWARLEPDVFLASAIFIEALLLSDEGDEPALRRPIPVCRAAEQLGKKNLSRTLKRRNAKFDSGRPVNVEFDDLIASIANPRIRRSFVSWADREYPAG